MDYPSLVTYILSPSPHHTAPSAPSSIMDQDASSSGGWRFAQCFGDKGEVEDITEGASSEALRVPARATPPTERLVPPPRTADIISTVEFDSTGNYLATGDKGGRVVLFERNEMVSTAPRVSRARPPVIAVTIAAC